MVITQEERFQLLDRDGVGHLFLLHFNAAVEPDQLPCLLHRPVRVSYRPAKAKSLIGHVALGIDLLEH